MPIFGRQDLCWLQERASTHVWFFVQPFHLQLVFEASALFFVIADLCNALVSDCDNILCSPPFKPPECFAIISVVCQLLVQ